MKELNVIQTRLNAPKNQRNTFANYNYRSCEDILEALKPLLKETGCTVVVSDDIVLVGDRYYIKATATITNGSGESVSNTAFAREPLNRKGSDESQITGATSSYARKYCLNGLFCIDDNKDPDAINTHDGTINNAPTDKPSTRGRKKQTESQDTPTPQPDMIAGGALNHALQELQFVTNEEGIRNFWGNWKGKLKPEEESKLVDAIHALPFYPKQQ